MYHQSTAWPTRPAAPSPASTTPPSGTAPLSKWIAQGLLALAGGVLLALAGAAAWLSYHAQVAYVLAHNGNLRTEARIWALLLDTGTAGVSLLRLHETVHHRANAATRASLVGCIAASVLMNLLHAPSPSAGGYLVATVPPVMYAVFLELLLTNLRNVLLPEAVHRSMWRTSTLWVHFPALMWNRQRALLRREAEGPASALEAMPMPNEHPRSTTLSAEVQLEQLKLAQDGASARERRRGRGPGPKRIAFEAALEHQVRSGDLRLFSGDERERNAAAYQAAASLPAPLSRGAARRYVVQALPRLEPAFSTRLE